MPGLARQADDRPLGDRGPRRGRRPCPARSVRTRAPLSLEPHLALPRAAARQHRRDGNGTETQGNRSEEHTSALQSLMRISYAVFCLKKKKYHIIADNKLTQQKSI